MGILKCEWADNCFGCPYSWCKKYCKGPNNNLHLSGANTIIATFLDRDYGYYKEKDLKDLAKRLDVTEADVLLHANTDGWLDGTLLIWVKDKLELIDKVQAFWPDGRTMLFENATKAAKHFGASLQIIGDRTRGRSICHGALLVKFDTPPSEDELIILRRNVPPVGDIPAPTAQEQEAIARVNEAHNDLRGKSGFYTSTLCRWATGEQLRLDTMYLVEDVLHISSGKVARHAVSGEPYRGVTFVRSEHYYETKET